MGVVDGEGAFDELRKRPWRDSGVIPEFNIEQQQV
jgi:hypothetical protein